MSKISAFPWMLRAAEAGYVPDSLIRLGMRRLLKERLRALSQGTAVEQDQRVQRLITDVDAGPIAISPDQANRQHYEVPAGFFRLVLGKRLKYSCCFWSDGGSTLDAAEEAALRVTCERAGIENGMRILELGCGWGSLSLWIAEHYPNSAVTAVSNSTTQREFIESTAADRGLRNLRVITADMNQFDPHEPFDRILSVEMFEHMRNHRKLLQRVSRWLRPEGRLFVHVFCHRRFAYLFESNSPQDWMAEHFFTGGMMPSDALLPGYDQHLRLTRQWRWHGGHYAKTCRAWLDRMDSQADSVCPIFEDCYGATEVNTWIQRWRIFFMACEELFAFQEGGEWYVSHYLFERRQHPPAKQPELQFAETAMSAAHGIKSDELP